MKTRVLSGKEAAGAEPWLPPAAAAVVEYHSRKRVSPGWGDRRKGLFRVRFLMAAAEGVVRPEDERAFTAKLTHSEAERFREAMEGLEREGRIRGFSIAPVPEEGWFDMGMCMIVVGTIKGTAEGREGP